jgi:hypothetical protein
MRDFAIEVSGELVDCWLQTADLIVDCPVERPEIADCQSETAHFKSAITN